MVVINIDWTYKEIIYTGNFFQRLFKIGPRIKPEKAKIELAAIVYDIKKEKQINLIYYGNLQTPGIKFDGDKVFKIYEETFPLQYWLLFFAYTENNLYGIKNIVINNKTKINISENSSGIWIGTYKASQNKFLVKTIPLDSKGITENVLEISKKVVE